MSVLLGYSKVEKDHIVREYLRGNGCPLCSVCGEEMVLHLRYRDGGQARIEAGCPGCANGFSWAPPAAVLPWQDLHLAYFQERSRQGLDLHCPMDDCRVLGIEYSDGVWLFRCPYCNRQGFGPRAGA